MKRSLATPPAPSTRPSVNVLYFNTTGSNNVAAGNGALLFNQTGSFNSAYG
jgi:hypothetical protein